MKRMHIAAAAALVAIAGTATANAKEQGDSKCTALWHRANPANAESITKRQAERFIADFAAASPKGSLTINAKDWQAACEKGLVKSPAHVAGTSDAPPAAKASTRRTSKE